MKRKYETDRPKLSRKSRELIEKINDIIDAYRKRGFRLTVRQAYYQLVARNLIVNNSNEYERIVDLITRGRFEGLIDWNVFEDRTREKQGNTHWTNPCEILNACANQYRIDTRATQDFYIECWVEKDGLIGILEKVSRRLDVPFYSSHGYSSVTALHETAERLKLTERKNVILYAGDHDPSGFNIFESIKKTLRIFNAPVEVKRIGITQEQIKKLNLPPYPAKEYDSNFKTYVANTGLTDAWELDALPPEFLMKIYEDEVNALTDFEKLHELQEIEKQSKTALFEISEKVA